MTDFNKSQSINTLKKYGWEYHGFLNAGWGEKFYTFTNPDKNRVTLKLGELRRKAYGVDAYHSLGLGL